MCKIEEAFEIKISEKKWIKMETVGDILKEILRGCKCIQ
jgi:acyl carrier protein